MKAATLWLYVFSSMPGGVGSQDETNFHTAQKFVLMADPGRGQTAFVHVLGK